MLKCPLLCFSRIFPAVAPQALLFSTVCGRIKGSVVSPPDGSHNSCKSCLFSQQFLGLFNKHASNSICTGKTNQNQSFPPLVHCNCASVVHSNPVEKHPPRTCRRRSPVRVYVCVWLVSHAATVISVSAVCFPVRPDSAMTSPPSGWLCVFVSAGLWRCVFVWVLLSKEDSRSDFFTSKCHF